MSEEIDLPVDVSELGDLVSAELECPGVYYLAVKPERDAILFIRGAKPVLDLKYKLMDHPAIRHTADGGGPPYIHHQTKPKTWLPGTALFAPEDADIKKEEFEHEYSEE